MFSNIVLQLFGFVGGALAIGQGFDKIFIPKNQQEKIHEYLRTHTGCESVSETVMRFIRLVKHSVFDRHFASRMFSWSYFRNASILSSLFLVAIGAAQFAYDPTPFKSLEWSFPQLTVLTICLVANLLVDWISIAQTQAFFEIAATLQRPSRAFLLIVSDFLVTINLFAILYAAAVAIPYLIIASVPSDTQLNVDSDTHVAPYGGTYDDGSYSDYLGYTGDNNYYDYTCYGGFGDQLETTFKISAGQLGRSSGVTKYIGQIAALSDPLNAETGAGAIKSCTKLYDVQPADLRPFVEPIVLADVLRISSNGTGIAVLGRNSVISLRSVTDEFDTVRDTHDCLSAPWKSPVAMRVACLTNWTQTESFRVKLDTTLSWADFVHAVQVTYSMTGSAQYEISDIFSREVAMVNLGDLFSNQPTQLLQSEAFTACVVPAPFDTNALLWAPSFGRPKKTCRRSLSISNVDLNRIAAGIRATASPFSTCRIPLNTLFLSSLTMTALLYLFSTLLVVAKMIWSLIFPRLVRIEPYFIRAPITAASLLLGILCFLISVT